MKISICLLFLICTLPLYSQINSDYNGIRSGDQIIKQQVEYKDPGKSGKSIFWDFSDVKTINNSYILDYNLPPLQGDSLYILGQNSFPKNKVKENEFIIGLEHNTMYYYRSTRDSLLVLGHENSAIQLKYTPALVQQVYPFNYGQTTKSVYTSTGLYSGTKELQTTGTIETSADAYGKLILPTGDTLNPVLRIKTLQTISELKDSLKINTQQLETYRWYTKGYRYPVFETMKAINPDNGTELFSTAFFFPLQDHFYLETDPANQAILDEMWNLDDESKQKELEDPTSKTVSIDDLLVCRMYPNPVESTLYLDYELKEDAKVSFELYSIDGSPIRTIAAKQKTVGNYNETMDCSSLQSKKTYILRIIANGIIVNEKIIRK